MQNRQDENDNRKSFFIKRKNGSVSNMSKNIVATSGNQITNEETFHGKTVYLKLKFRFILKQVISRKSLALLIAGNCNLECGWLLHIVMINFR